MLDGYKTKLAAVGLALVALGQALQGEFESAIQTGLAALAAFGLRKAIEQTPEAPE